MDPKSRAAQLKEGLGDFSIGPGHAYVTRVLGGTTAPAPGAQPRRLAHFVHLSDLQLLDDESPARVGILDAVGDLNSAFRPHEGHACRFVEAAVRTINALHAKDPVDFVLLGGDNIDNAQANEADWVLAMLSRDSQTIDCDSGSDDDPIPGPDNDVKDPFVSAGLSAPFLWVNGNHDVLFQGNLEVSPALSTLAQSSSPSLGTRDYRLPEAPMVTTDVPPDARREMLMPKALLERVAAHEGGHGLTAEQAATGRAFYTRDLPGSPVRFLIMDTTSQAGGARGMLRRSELDRYVRPALDRALSERKLVVITSHHGWYALTKDGGMFGSEKDDAVTTREWLAFVDAYPNVIASVVGHAHEHRVGSYTMPSGREIWEVLTASLLDYPGQFRELELIDQDNGWLTLRATCIDFKDDGDPILQEGRRLMYLDWVTGWAPDPERGPEHLNVELWMKNPFAE